MDKKSGVGKGNYGKYSSIFWRFYQSEKPNLRKEYGDIAEAIRAQVAMLKCMSRKHIFNVRITRRRNILYLKKTEVGNVRRDNS